MIDYIMLYYVSSSVFYLPYMVSKNKILELNWVWY